MTLRFDVGICVPALHTHTHTLEDLKLGLLILIGASPKRVPSVATAAGDGGRESTREKREKMRLP